MAILGVILVGTIAVVRLSLTGSEPTGAPEAPVEQSTAVNVAGDEKSVDNLAKAVEVAKQASPQPICRETIRLGHVTGVISGKRIRVDDGSCTVTVAYAGVRGFPSPSHAEAAATRNAALVSDAEVTLEYAESSEFSESVFISDVFVDNQLISETLVSLGLLDVDLEQSVSLYGERLERARAEARRLRRGAWRDAETVSDKPAAATVISPSTDGENAVDTESIQIIAINPFAEVVTVSNMTSENQDLSGWKIVAVEADKTYVFPEKTTLEPGASIQIVSGTSGAPPSRLFWTSEKIWQDDQSDTAQILDARGRLISSYPR